MLNEGIVENNQSMVISIFDWLSQEIFPRYIGENINLMMGGDII